MSSKISWTNETWNPLVGCSIVSPGCTNCYAMRMARRVRMMSEGRALDPSNDHYFGTTKVVNKRVVWTGKVGIAPDRVWEKPFSWKKHRLIFVNSMSDLFHESIDVEHIDRVMATIALTPHHTYQILTKRPKRMFEYMNDLAMPSRVMNAAYAVNPDAARNSSRNLARTFRGKSWKMPNLWLGISAEDNQRAKERIPYLSLTDHAAVRWASFEPLLEAVRPDLIKSSRCLDWAVIGSESGHGARECTLSDISATINSLRAIEVPIFVKQIPDKAPGRPLKDVDLFPWLLSLREWPDEAGF